MTTRTAISNGFRLAKQQLCTSNTSRFFLDSFAVVVWLRCETSKLHILWRMSSEDNDFLFFFFNLDSAFYSPTPEKLANIGQTARDGIIVMFETARTHFLLGWRRQVKDLRRSGMSQSCSRSSQSETGITSRYLRSLRDFSASINTSIYCRNK